MSTCTTRTLIALSLCGIAWCSSSSAAELKHGTFKTSDGINIHYVESGAGSPVILVHGYTGSAEGTWVRNGVFDALAKNHRVIALDCRNHGKSDKPQPNGQGEARDVVELMDHLKVAKAHIHGYSMGGGITQRLLTMIPDRMSSAIFGGSGIAESDPEWAAKVTPDKQGRDPQEDEARHSLRVRHAMDNGTSKEDAEKEVAAREAEDAARGARGATAGAARGAAEGARGAAETARGGAARGGGRGAASPLDLTKLTIPMMVINGEFDSPNRKSTRIARQVKDHKIIILPGKSHNTAVSAGYIPKEYIEGLVAFIDAHDTK